MLELKKVAVTGGLSSGKSAVCNFFKQLKCYVISADEIVHNLLSLQTDEGHNVVALLGDEVVENGKINRKLIAKKVFNDPLLLKKLEECLYPAVSKEIKRHYQKAKHLNPPLFVVEIPKLFESGMNAWFDVCLTVAADESLAADRFVLKGGSKKEYDQRMKEQMPIAEKSKRSNYILKNNGSLEDLKAAVNNLFHEITIRGALS